MAIVETLDLVHRLPGKYLVCVAVVSRANETSRDGSETNVKAGGASDKTVRAIEKKNEEQVRLYEIGNKYLFRDYNTNLLFLSLSTSLPLFRSRVNSIRINK